MTSLKDFSQDRMNRIKIKIKTLFKNQNCLKIEFLLYVVIVFTLSSGWLNDKLPTGLDTLGGFQIFRYVLDTFLNYGFLPAWNPYWFLGHPFFYTFSVWVYTPFSVNIFLFKLAWLVVFILSGIFLYELAFMLIGNRFSSFIAGLIYMFTPYHVLAVSYAGNGWLNILFALLPLTFLFIERTFEKPVLRNSILSGFCVAAIILVHPQASILTTSFLLLYILFRFILLKTKKIGKGAGSDISHTFCIVVTSLFLGLLLSTYWWLPFLSERTFMSGVKFTIKEVRGFSLDIVEALTLRPLPPNIPSFYVEGITTYITMISIIIPILASIGMVLSWRNMHVQFFSISGLIALTLAMGANSPIPLFLLAFEYIPFFNGIRTPGRFLLYASFSCALLAGFGIKELMNQLLRKRRKLSAILVFSTITLMIISIGVEMSRGYSTFDLTNDQKRAMKWLAEKNNPTLLPFPSAAWIIINEEKESVVNPWYYFCLTKTRTLKGGLGNYRPNYRLNYRPPLDETIDILGIEYILFDWNYLRYVDESSLKKVNKIYALVMSSKKFVLVWKEGNVEIFQNTKAFPKIYLQSKQSKQFFFDNISFSSITPEKYKVNVKLEEPAYLIFTQSYYPKWVAKNVTTGSIIRAEPFYGGHCAFPLEKGEYELIIYYEKSPQDKIGITISILTLITCLTYLAKTTLYTFFCA